jgi:hypothetical protein
MGQLFFKKPLQDAIREGRKRTTIRRWARPLVRAGAEAFAPGVGWLAIESVESVELEHLSDADALADGFDSHARLLAALHALYPDQARDGKQWFMVRFTVARGLERKAGRDAPGRVASPRHPRGGRAAPSLWDTDLIPDDLDVG